MTMMMTMMIVMFVINIVFLSSIWGQINLLSGAECIVAIPQRTRECGKHSDLEGPTDSCGTNWAEFRPLSFGLWKLLQSPKWTLDVEHWFNSTLRKRKLAKDHPESSFMESLHLPYPLPPWSISHHLLSVLPVKKVTACATAQCLSTCMCFGTSVCVCLQVWGSHVPLCLWIFAQLLLEV